MAHPARALCKSRVDSHIGRVRKQLYPHPVSADKEFGYDCHRVHCRVPETVLNRLVNTTAFDGRRFDGCWQRRQNPIISLSNSPCEATVDSNTAYAFTMCIRAGQCFQFVLEGLCFSIWPLPYDL